MQNSSRTTAALLTPRGRGAVATIAVHGVDASPVVARLFRSATGRSFVDAPRDAILFGRWNGPYGEEVVVCRTNDDEVEIHCHGGLAAAEAILDSLIDHDIEKVSPDAWLARRARGTLEAGALALLPQARTLRTAAIIHDQYAGAMREKLVEIIAMLDHDRTAAARELDLLYERAAVGRHVVEPFRVVIAGAPNVGKSSLVNALVGYQRAIVFDEPGTTRDAVTVATAMDGWPIELCDTAGLRATSDSIERLGIERALSRLTEADLRVLVFDASLPWSDEDERLRSSWPVAIVVRNKADLAKSASGCCDGLATSAVTGEGIETLIDMISRRLVSVEFEPGAAVPITSRQMTAISTAREALAHCELDAASMALTSLLA